MKDLSINSHNYLTQTPDLKGKKILIQGLGMTGAQIELAHFLSKKGALVTITDTKKPHELGKSLSLLKRKKIKAKLILGKHILKDFEACDIIYPSPAVTPDNKYLLRAIFNGASIDTETNLFYRENRQQKIVAITGTKGKGTTSQLTSFLLNKLGIKNEIGGNCGTSLLNNRSAKRRPEISILELSSFQLHHLKHVSFTPDIACCLRIFEEHINYHGSMKNYVSSKAAICAGQNRTQVRILHISLASMAEFRAGSKLLTFSANARDTDCFLNNKHIMLKRQKVYLPEMDSLRMKVLNIDNLLASLLITSELLPISTLTKPNNTIPQLLNTFRPEPYRINLSMTLSGRLFINDSASTHPEATLNALKHFEHKSVSLIIGGEEKGISNKRLFEGLKSSNIRRIYLIGSNTKKLKRQLDDSNIPAKTMFRLERAVKTAYKESLSGEVILFSPSFSSFDQYSNYRERGNHFDSLVSQLDPKP